MMPYIRKTPLPSVNIQIVKETFRNRLHEKKNCRPQALSKLYYVTGSQLNTLVSYTCTTFTCVYACKYENWGFFRLFCLLAFVISWIPEHCSDLSIRFKKILTSSHLETLGSLLFKMNLKIFIPIRLHNIKA